MSEWVEIRKGVYRWEANDCAWVGVNDIGERGKGVREKRVSRVRSE